MYSKRPQPRSFRARPWLAWPLWRGQIYAAACRRLLERPNQGAVLINGVDCVGLSDKEQTRIRRMEIGFIYQFHHLLPEFSRDWCCTAHPRADAQPGRGAGQGAARLARACRALGSPAGAAFRRRATARRDRSGASQPTESAARRRAHRQSRSTDRGAVFEQLLKLVRKSGVAAVIATQISISPPAWTASCGW